MQQIGSSSAKMTVTKTLRLNRETTTEERDELLQVQTFATEPALVHVSVGVTKNLGDFNSLKLSIGVTKPCYPEEIAETQKDVQTFIEQQIKKEVKSLNVKLPF